MSNPRGSAARSMRALSGSPPESGARPSLARLIACKSIAPRFARRSAHDGMHGVKARPYQASASRARRSDMPSVDAAFGLQCSVFLDTRRLARQAETVARRCRDFSAFLARFRFRLKFRGRAHLAHSPAPPR